MTHRHISPPNPSHHPPPCWVHTCSALCAPTTSMIKAQGIAKHKMQLWGQGARRPVSSGSSVTPCALVQMCESLPFSVFSSTTLPVEGLGQLHSFRGLDVCSHPISTPFLTTSWKGKHQRVHTATLCGVPAGQGWLVSQGRLAGTCSISSSAP